MGFDLRDQLQEIQCPVLVMAGVLDPMVTIEDARELAAGLPQERTIFLEFENAGHMLALEQPGPVVDAALHSFSAEPSSTPIALECAPCAQPTINHVGCLDPSLDLRPLPLLQPAHRVRRDQSSPLR